jgi:DNA-binding response OmpR family regulator
LYYILITHHEPVLARFLQRFIAHAYPSATVVSPTSPLEVYRLTIQHTVDLVVIDGRNLSFIQQLRAQHVQTQVLVVSGDPSKEPAARAAGASAFLATPFSIEHFIVILNTLLPPTPINDDGITMHALARP